MNRYLAQKKEELVQATAKNNTKKGCLLANMKMPKNGKQQHVSRETFETMNLPTEEDDQCKGYGNELMTEVYSIGNLVEK